jgi:hypothetical protein
VVSTSEGGKKGCALLRGEEGRSVDWRGRQEGVWTAEGDRRWCRPVREARRDVPC